MTIFRHLSLPAMLTLVAASPVTSITWGKRGISYSQYRSDSIECAKHAYWADIRNLPETKAFVHAVNALDRSINGGGNGASWEDNMRLLRPNARMDQVGEYHENVLESCLIGKGYVKFVLLPHQINRLKRFKPGSDERQAYLYSLAMDQNVLANQSIKY